MSFEESYKKQIAVLAKKISGERQRMESLKTSPEPNYYSPKKKNNRHSITSSGGFPSKQLELLSAFT